MTDFSSASFKNTSQQVPLPSFGNSLTAESLRSFALFADLTPPQREHLVSQMQPVTIPARTILLAAGQPGHAVYFLLEGTVKIGLERPSGPRTQKPFSIGKGRATPPLAPALATGAQVMLNLCGPGSVLGELSVLDGRGHSANVMTREMCRLLWLDKDAFLEAVEKIPGLSLALLRECSERLRNATRQLHAYATLDAAGRVAHAFLHLAERFGQETSEGVRLDIGLTQPDLTGLTRTRVSTVIGVFRKNDWLEQEEGGAMTLRDVVQLSSIAHRTLAP